MKILHIFDHSIPLHSGYTFRSRSILMYQHKLGLQTSHITSSKQGKVTASLKDSADGLEFYRTPEATGFLARLPVIGQLVTIYSLAKRLEDVVWEEQPDVLHAHSPALNGVAALIVGKKLKIPVVYEVRGFWEDAAVDHGTCKEGDLRYKLSKMMETYVVKKCQAVTAICEGIRQDFVSRGIKKTKITLIPNAVSVDSFPQITERSPSMLEKLKIGDAFVIGFAGSFYQYEGIDILIKSLSILKLKGLNIKVLLVGGGVQQQNIESLIKQLDLQDNVILTGRVPHEEVKDYYSVMDVTVLPRKSMRLTELVTPLKPLEAMALGVPVIASDIGGHKEIITDNETGFLFKADDEKALADAIQSIMENSEKVPDVIKNARNYVEEVRNWEVSVSNYPAVYQFARKI
ncbi:MAG: glycosyltransferase, exosortase A system-associated [Alteromonadaceae bacterium]|nr:glycosyltransferase, exosortase A system-associated [Alteromonadaceae bacterium]